MGDLMVALILFFSISGPLQTVQSAEYRGVILALQAFSDVHVGIDNLNVLRGVPRLHGQGDLFAIMPFMLRVGEVMIQPRFPSLKVTLII